MVIVQAHRTPSGLRAEAGRNPYDKALSDLIGELSTRGDTFRQRWAQPALNLLASWNAAENTRPTAFKQT